jgi:FkbM family methyltransferase
MNRKTVFDGYAQIQMAECRGEFLKQLLRELASDTTFTTALDVGCGIGYFSGILSDIGLKVTGCDARTDNIDEAKRRHRMIDFRVYNIEDGNIRELGTFDLTLCFGLLYHLENPFQAIRNLHAVTEKVLIIESMVIPGISTKAALVDESHGKDRGLHYIAFIPSKTCLTKMLYRAGFTEVYETVNLPDDTDFRGTFKYTRRRTVLVASKFNLTSPKLRLISEPQQDATDLWMRKWMYLPRYLIRSTKKCLKRSWSVLARFPYYPPLPVYLPWGVWWLLKNDAMGRNIIKRNGFEQPERDFLLKFLKQEMTFIDIGAHQGYYTLLASRKTGLSGRVIAFEPSPRELHALRIHLLLNRCHNVHIEPVALSDDTSTAKLFVCLGQETGCNSLRRPLLSERMKTVKVPVRTLDEYFKKGQIATATVIKIDAEGAELSILKGATNLLYKVKPVLLCELADIRTKPWGYKAVEIYDFLKTAGYQWFSITSSGYLKPCPRKPFYNENLLAVPEEKVPLIQDHMLKGNHGAD